MLKRRQMICTGRILMLQKTIVSCACLFHEECLKDERSVHFLGVLARKEKHGKKKKESWYHRSQKIRKHRHE